MIKDILKPIIKSIKLALFQIKWRKCNKDNYTVANAIFPIDKVKVGYKTYGKLNVAYYGNPIEKLTIGRYCSIANDVKFILGGEHHPEFISNYLFKYFLEPNEDVDDRRSKGQIVIQDDVWIGINAIILSGVTIGQGAIIAAGSVVAKDVPPYAIYTTNRIIKYRFSQEIINKLLKIDFEKIDFDFIKKNMNLFYSKDVMEVLNNPLINKISK